MKLKLIVVLLLLAMTSCSSRRKLTTFTERPLAPNETFLRPALGWGYDQQVPHKPCGKYLFVTGNTLQITDSGKDKYFLRIYPVDLSDVLVLVDDSFKESPRIENLQMLTHWSFKVLKMGEQDYENARECRLPKPLESR